MPTVTGDGGAVPLNMVKRPINARASGSPCWEQMSSARATMLAPLHYRGTFLDWREKGSAK